MSIPVPLDELRDVAARQASFAYLLTVGEDERAHAVAIVPAIGEHEIVAEAGGTTCRNAAARAGVSLLWPPAQPGDYSLIVDADARVEGSTITLVPTRAVRHRAAPAGGNDCVPVNI
jgi:hypothetical protein